jgi:hypothetical protein
MPALPRLALGRIPTTVIISGFAWNSQGVSQYLINNFSDRTSSKSIFPPIYISH